MLIGLRRLRRYLPGAGCGVVWLGKRDWCSVGGKGSTADLRVAVAKGRHWVLVRRRAILSGFESPVTAGPRALAGGGWQRFHVGVGRRY